MTPVRTTTRLTLTEYAVLALLVHARREISGYDLRKFAESGVGYVWQPSKSQTYAVLARLVESGHATRREVRQTERPDKQLYRATRAGRSAVREWLDSDETETDPDRSTFLLKFFFGTQANRDAMARQLAAFRDLYAERLSVYEQVKAGRCDPGSDEFTFLALDYGIARARAAVEWADATLGELAA